MGQGPSSAARNSLQLLTQTAPSSTACDSWNQPRVSPFATEYTDRTVKCSFFFKILACYYILLQFIKSSKDSKKDST